VIVHERHDEVGASIGEPATELLEAGIHPLALLRLRHLRPAGHEGTMRHERGRDDLSHGRPPIP
jgi:hypothetical protein